MTDTVLDQQLVRELRDIMGDDFDNLVAAFVRDGRERLAGLREACGGDPEHLQQLAHSFKGSSSNLGALEMTELCLALEQHAVDQARAEQLLDQLEVAYQRACEALGAC